MAGCFKVRTLLQELRMLGCRPERVTGSHQVWRTPAGAHVTVVVNHANADVSRLVLASIRHTLRKERLQLGKGTRGHKKRRR